MPSEAEQRVWSVSELNSVVRELLENTLLPLWVSGEIGNLTLHRSGHVYLTLKDEKAQTRAVWFGGLQACRSMNLREGDRVEAFGSVSLYEPRGDYQFYIRKMHPCGIGALQQRFEELKRKLAALGYFDESRKKPIPLLPRRIGVVSSPSGAAVKDFLRIALARFPNLHVRIYPAPVQGRGAERKLAEGVRFFNRIGETDVVVLTRGGGSLEDLWPFNEEELAQAIFESRIPVVSAVGHEIDFCISDFVADLRAPTPSGAAEALIPEKKALVENVKRCEMRSAAAIELLARKAAMRLDAALASRVFRDSEHLTMVRMQSLDLLMRDAAAALQNAWNDKDRRLTNSISAMNAFSPYGVLKRGYAYLLNPATQKPVGSVADVEPGAILRAVLADGTLEIEAKSKTSEPPGSGAAPETP